MKYKVMERWYYANGETAIMQWFYPSSDRNPAHQEFGFLCDWVRRVKYNNERLRDRGFNYFTDMWIVPA